MPKFKSRITSDVQLFICQGHFGMYMDCIIFIFLMSSAFSNMVKKPFSCFPLTFMKTVYDRQVPLALFLLTYWSLKLWTKKRVMEIWISKKLCKCLKMGFDSHQVVFQTIWKSSASQNWSGKTLFTFKSHKIKRKWKCYLS